MRVSKTLVASPPPAKATDRVLVLFPYAGGGATVFSDWHHYFPDCRCFAVQYRGRLPEGKDDVITRDIERVAQDVCEALETALQGTPSAQLFFYGHSFGALVAWLVAGTLQRRGGDAVVRHLFCGAEEAPSWGSEDASLRLKQGPKPYADMSLEEFTNALVANGMLSEQNKAFGSFMAPTKAEFEMDQGFSLRSLRQAPPTLTCDVTCFYETEDDVFGLEVENVEPWAQFTSGEFQCVPVHGPHLFMLPQHNETELCEMLADAMAK